MPPPTPSTAPARLLSGGCPGGGGSKTASKSIKKSIIFLDRFLIRLRPMLMPFWLHFCSQIALGHSSLSKTLMFTKTLKTNEKSTFLTPRRLGNRPKIAPRRLQEVTFSLLDLHLLLIYFCSVLAPQMPPFGHPFCIQNRFKKYIKNQVPKKSPQDHTISLQDGPRSLQEAPRGSQESQKAP